MHLDIDAFFASVEQLRNPHLKGRPVIVGSGCIASCSYEARRYGLYAGQGLSDAKHMCPQAVILEGNYAVYRCFTERIWDMCRNFCPDVDTYLDDAYLDVTGTDLIYPDILKSAAQFRTEIRRETGLSVTAGIGTTRTVARMASKSAKPDGLLLVQPWEVKRFLAGFKIEDLPGIGMKTAEILHRLNIQTVGELQQLPQKGLESLFGKNGLVLFERCRGLDTRALTRKEIPQSISRETTFHKNTTARSEIEGMLHYLVERMGKTLRQLGCQVKRINLKIRYSDFASNTARCSLLEPSHLDTVLYCATLQLLKKAYTRRVALRHVGVSVTNISPAHELQQELFADASTARIKRLLSAIDTIRDRFGFSSLIVGKSANLLGKLNQDSYGYILRTPSLTK